MTALLLSVIRSPFVALMQQCTSVSRTGIWRVSRSSSAGAHFGTSIGPYRPPRTACLLHGRQERYPALTAAFGSAAGHGSQDKALDFGLARILDGVGLLIASRA